MNHMYFLPPTAVSLKQKFLCIEFSKWPLSVVIIMGISCYANRSLSLYKHNRPCSHVILSARHLQKIKQKQDDYSAETPVLRLQYKIFIRVTHDLSPNAIA